MVLEGTVSEPPKYFQEDQLQADWKTQKLYKPAFEGNGKTLGHHHAKAQPAKTGLIFDLPLAQVSRDP
ncbi:uncharacterized protein N7469_004603 [Penicillium citrinum]|uniref:Uncharacterized protein n=1 Tax=Penicillium citrinum TaxID=5077 RepID=A0A9W9TQQ4_PENCI|nr:uncharacterized protein N7469_004603 [Penicillium citrinum]KAJ5235435.1 hypothetical protein N7469_004603 [Penicillium citrinum]